MILYVQVEWQAEFAPDSYACKQMLPYFFAASHWNYARDGVAYMRTMERLLNSVLEPFMKGEYAVHLRRRFWNGIWSDMSIETRTYILLGKQQTPDR